MFYENAKIKGVSLFLVCFLFIGTMYYGIHNGSSQHLIKNLAEQEFPLEMILTAGLPGLRQPAADRVDGWRRNMTNLGLFFLTGVHLSDARTYFLSFYAPPKEGPAWLGWVYFPDDPEMEGPIPQLIEDLWEEPVEPAPAQNESDILVGIYHTHSGEAYSGDGGPDRAPSGEEGGIVDVGRTLAATLNELGVAAAHAQEVNDAVYAESYDLSLLAAQKLLSEHPTIRILLDLHRDGLPESVGKNVTTINGKSVARVMIVVGQRNPHWQENNALAEKMIQLGENKYPGLFLNKIRYASKARYNQHLSGGALLLEIGSQLNTEAEAQAAAVYLAEILKSCL